MKRTTKLALTGVACYLAAIAPRLLHRPEPMPRVYYAHRGLHDNNSDAPENTMAAFRKAVEHGYGIELDVQMTRDGQVVVVHDFNLKRVCGVDIDVDKLTYEQLKAYPIYGSQETIPLFQDVLDMVDGRIPLIVELKYKNSHSLVCEKTDAILRNYTGTYCIESFHPSAVFWFRLNHPEVCRGQLSSNYKKHDGKTGWSMWAARHLLMNFMAKPDFIAYDCRDMKAVSKNICRDLFGCPSVAWTVKSQAQLDECRKYYDYFIFEGFIPEE